MAAATYATDLTTLADGVGETWREATATGWTNVFAITDAETDAFIQNVSCTSCTFKTGVGILIPPALTGFTLPTDGAILGWLYWTAPNSLANLANGGIRGIIGTALNAFYSFDLGGSDTYTLGGWENFAWGDPGASDVTPDDTVGSPGTSWTVVGMGVNASTVPSKGNPLFVDVLREGRCEIYCINGDGTGYGNAADMAQENDYNDNTNGYNRWGLFTAVPGGYLWKGLWSIGQSGTAADWRDSNVAISIADTPHCTGNFNKIEINHASTRVDWTNYTISALGTKSPGNFEMIDNADVNISQCTFVDMGTFVFQSNGAATDCIWRGCGQITPDGADISGSSVSGYEGTADTSAVIWNNATDPNGDLDDMVFTKGTAATHAIEFGLSSPTTINLSNISFTSYGADTTTSAALHFKRTSSTVTVNLANMSTPTYKSDGATINFVASVQVTLTGLVNGTEVRVYDAGDGSVIAGTESVTGNQFQFNDTSGNIVNIRIFALGYLPADLEDFTVAAGSVPVSQVVDRVYVNPA